jgi:hypothetical protein
MAEPTFDRELVRVAAEAIAYARYPDQTVDDDPELVWAMEPEARAVLAAITPAVEQRIRQAQTEVLKTFGEWSLKHCSAGGCVCDVEARARAAAITREAESADG